MAQPKPEKISLEQVLKLVNQLPQNDREELRRSLNSPDWGEHFQQLCDKVESRRVAEGLPQLTEEEIMAEVKAAREEMRAARGQSNC